MTESIQNCITFLCVTAVLQITALQDVRDMDNVTWWLFLPLPIVRVVFLIVNPGMSCYWSPVLDSVAGSVLGVLALVLSLVGLCGGADIVMIACVGFTVGFVDAVHSLLYASTIMLIVQIVVSLRNRSLKGLSRKSVPYIPYFTAGFVLAFVINHFMEVY